MRQLIDLTQHLIRLRKKPSTQEQFKQYPQMLLNFRDLVNACEDADKLKQILLLDSGYFLLAGDRQQVIEKLLMLERSPPTLRAYAMQLELFGDVDEFGQANLDIDTRVQALYDEAENLER